MWGLGSLSISQASCIPSLCFPEWRSRGPGALGQTVLPAERPQRNAQNKGLEEGGPKGQEISGGCSLLEIYADQKERKRGRESLSRILWTFYPSFTTAFVINKYDTYAFCLESTTKRKCHTAWVTFHRLWTESFAWQSTQPACRSRPGKLQSAPGHGPLPRAQTSILTTESL